MWVCLLVWNPNTRTMHYLHIKRRVHDGSWNSTGLVSSWFLSRQFKRESRKQKAGTQLWTQHAWWNINLFEFESFFVLFFIKAIINLFEFEKKEKMFYFECLWEIRTVSGVTVGHIGDPVRVATQHYNPQRLPPFLLSLFFSPSFFFVFFLVVATINSMVFLSLCC